MAPEAIQKASKCIIGKDYPLAIINHVTASRTNMERMKQVYQHLAKYRNSEFSSTVYINFKINIYNELFAGNDNGGGSAISSMLAKAQASALANVEQINSSPSPTTILKTVNSSGTYMCSTTRSFIDMPSPVVIYHEHTTTNTTQKPQQNNSMMQHRNMNNICLKDHHTQFDFEENDENSNQHHQQFQYHNSYNFSQSQSQIISNETQQQEDQHSIELRMNNLGNERQDVE
jgi:cryptochrome